MLVLSTISILFPFLFLLVKLDYQSNNIVHRVTINAQLRKLFVGLVANPDCLHV